jgi:hypothetical protein
MFNIEKALTGLKGLVGFEQSYTTDAPAVDSDLVASSSSMYIGQGVHPLLSYENILACAQDFGKTAIKDWSSSITYNRDAVVKVGATLYRALRTNVNAAPASNAADWSVSTLLSAYLRKLYTNSSAKLLHALFTKKKVNEASKQILGNLMLFEGQGNINRRIDKRGRFVGLRITLKHPDTIGLIHKLGLQLDTAQSDVELYLYHSSSDTPLHTWTINHTNSVKFQWHEIETKMIAYVGDEVNAGGHYYIGYYENDITGQAIAKDIQWTKGGGCSSCSEAVINRNLFAQWGKFVEVQPFYVDTPPTGELWNEELEMYLDETNFGLNIQMAVQCDMTRIILEHKSVLADAMVKQLTVDLLTEMAYSVRDNQLKQRVAGLASVALDNQENGQMGAVKILMKTIEALDFDLSNLSAVCNPCNNNQTTYKRRSIWQ